MKQQVNATRFTADPSCVICSHRTPKSRFSPLSGWARRFPHKKVSFMEFMNSTTMPRDLSFSFTSPSQNQSNLVMEYGEPWAAGDKDSTAKRGEDIAFQQTDCPCHHEKPLLIARQYAARCREAPHIGRPEFPWLCLVDAAAC